MTSPITTEQAERLLEIANARTETPCWQRIEDAAFDYSTQMQDYRHVCNLLVGVCRELDEMDRMLDQMAVSVGNTPAERLNWFIGEFTRIARQMEERARRRNTAIRSLMKALQGQASVDEALACARAAILEGAHQEAHQEAQQ